ncbi:MucR family transcriptional regulator [Methylorubrum rhodesianum]|uniref:MucR family transcriptional regulator n=1 Tax=Methylorubrum rhodesianum TaxID=29427 RepID=UPI001FEDF2EC|nr:MucR family transcriptional regulator [Methylorubrum rhodesianum]
MDDLASTSVSTRDNLVELTADIVAAYISNNSLPATELPAFLTAIHGAVRELRSPSAPAERKVDPATPSQIRNSITYDALISFEDGKPYKTLKRHLTKVGLSPDEYRRKWGLPRDYPLVAASYSATRSALARKLGLGKSLVRENERRKAAPQADADAGAAGKAARAPKPRTAAAAAE